MTPFDDFSDRVEHWANEPERRVISHQLNESLWAVIFFEHGRQCGNARWDDGEVSGGLPEGWE